MKVMVAGGTGFLGSALQARLREAKYDVWVLSRRGAAANSIQWQPDGTAGPWAAALDGADAVINLAGAGIADARWTTARKELLYTSRILSTRSIVKALREVGRPPSVLISASGVGYYGDRGNELVTEDSGPGTDFLAQLCVEWEREAEAAAGVTRVVILRNGLVMDPSGGALAKMLLPFRLGLGGPLGSGTQYMPWIHIEDWLALLVHLMTAAGLSGPFNITAPVPATNVEFTRALGRTVHRPAMLPVPGFALRIALGELATTLLGGQRAVPRRAEQSGFSFRFPEVETALRALLP
jgi:uncharacterized protein (TIGR01777 family)